MQEFLNPKSMITPGIAGGMVMLLANGLCQPFPELPARYVALGLSFLVGAITLHAAAMKLHQRTFYWVINSLVIFAVGFGANSFAREPTPPARTSVTAPATGASALSWLLPSAHAQAPTRDPKGATAAKTPAPPRPAPEPPRKEKAGPAATETKEKSPFFRKW